MNFWFPVLAILASLNACLQLKEEHDPVVSDSNTMYNDYWYNNEAELSSYSLQQARYGEIHDGTAVLVFVTEPFSPRAGTKAENPASDEVSVLKLNFTKKFNTGIYPYSMMTSTFFPFSDAEYSVKVSASSQEWCGHTYMELLNKKQFEVTVASYFQGESISKKVAKTLLEDDIWTRIRLHPNQLPTGKHKMIPSFASLRLLHLEAKAYDCEITFSEGQEQETATYSIYYPELDRSLSIRFEKEFPYKILGWEESNYSGRGPDRKKLTTTGRLKKTIKSDYWNKHSNIHSGLRAELGIE